MFFSLASIIPKLFHQNNLNWKHFNSNFKSAFKTASQVIHQKYQVRRPRHYTQSQYNSTSMLQKPTWHDIKQISFIHFIFCNSMCPFWFHPYPNCKQPKQNSNSTHTMKKNYTFWYIINIACTMPSIHNVFIYHLSTWSHLQFFFVPPPLPTNLTQYMQSYSFHIFSLLTKKK